MFAVIIGMPVFLAILWVLTATQWGRRVSLVALITLAVVSGVGYHAYYAPPLSPVRARVAPVAEVYNCPTNPQELSSDDPDVLLGNEIATCPNN